MKPFTFALRGLAAFVALSPLAHSQTQSPAATLPKVRVEADSESSYTTETAAATKTDTLLRDTPQSISVVTREVMNDQNVQNIADVVRYVPGIGMAQGEGNRETPVLRGSSSTGDFFLDGMRDDVQYYRDLYNIERVEILKGPNGMLFGRGGIGGLINRVTKEATRDSVRELSFQGGSHSNRRVSADLGNGIGENAALRINGVFEDSESYRDGVTLEVFGLWSCC
jgi:catecholate siderophore receptor